MNELMISICNELKSSNTEDECYCILKQKLILHQHDKDIMQSLSLVGKCLHQAIFAPSGSEGGGDTDLRKSSFESENFYKLFGATIDNEQPKRIMWTGCGQNSPEAFHCAEKFKNWELYCIDVLCLEKPKLAAIIKNLRNVCISIYFLLC